MVEQIDSVFDYVVVGGGLAGCAVAARLSENPDARVILIEAGDENLYEQSYYSTGVHAMLETEANWAFKTVPQPALNNAEVAQPRGKVIGGSAAINIGSWSRGIAADYEREGRPQLLRGDRNEQEARRRRPRASRANDFRRHSRCQPDDRSSAPSLH
jgi:choline dehydrogenase-like flavoprotein